MRSRFLLVAVLPALSVLAACSSGPAADGGADPGTASKGKTGPSVDAGYDSAPPLDSGLGVLMFSPEESYTGFDGSHDFRVPVAVYDAADDLTVTASDPSAVSIAKTQLANPLREDGTFDNGTYFMVTVNKPGTFTLVALSRGKSAQGTLHVADYAAARWALGEQRYKAAGASGDPPCTQCHVNGKAIDHSPASMASANDEALSVVITTGISTAGFPIRTDVGGHSWTVSAAERDGLVTYLRGLAPRGFE